MMDTPPTALLWTALRRAGWLGPAEPTPLGGGNQDRHPAQHRSPWRAARADGRPLVLTVARDLSAPHTALAAFAGALPDVAPTGYFWHRDPLGWDVLGQDFIAGATLSQQLADAPPARHPGLAAALRDFIGRLHGTAQPSTVAARAAEWQAQCARWLALPGWTEADRTCLTRHVFPRLGDLLCAGEPVTRWIHGDLTGHNLLLDDAGRLRPIDVEFSARTHFPSVEAARFHLFTPEAAPLAPWLGDALPPADLAAELCCWLEQVAREATYNTLDYVARWRPERLGRIRRLAEILHGGPLEECPWPALGAPAALSPTAAAPHLEAAVEECRWQLDSPDTPLFVAGWCWAHSAQHGVDQVAIQAGGRILVRTTLQPRPDVQQHFGGNPRAASTGFRLAVPLPRGTRELAFVAELSSGESVPFHTLALANLPRLAPVFPDYAAWAGIVDPDPPADSTAASPLLFSVLTPVYNPEDAHLRAAIESVLHQHHPHWELLLVDDASPAPHVAATLGEFAARDPRIRLLPRTTNGGIARATNAALAAARGDFIVLLDHDDVLRPHALAVFAQALAAEPDLDALYSDEDKLDPQGRRCVPLFKPAYSPEFLRGVMMIGHALCVRTTVAIAVDGFDSRYDGLQDFEFMLRVGERTPRLRHIPRLLYHWRQAPASSARQGNIKGDMDALQVAAVNAHLRRLGQPRQARALGGHRVRVDPRPDVSPPRLAQVCFDPAVSLGESLRRGAARDEVDVILFHAAGIDLPPPPEQHALAALALLPDAGVVAPVWLTAEGRIAESGLTVSPGTVVPVMAGYDRTGDGYHGSLRCHREVWGVSPDLFALAPHVLAAALSAEPQGWWTLLARLRASGRHHRVCASVQRTRPARYNPPDLPGSPPPHEADPYFNPHFSSAAADYTLANLPPHLPIAAHPIIGRLETTPPARVADGCLDLRGWAWHAGGAPVSVLCTAGPLRWSMLAQLPRPDVALVYPGFTDGACGFRLRLRLPPGRHVVRLFGRSGHQDSPPWCEQTVRVPWRAQWDYLRGRPPLSLIAFQLAATAATPARAIVPERFPRRHHQVRTPRFAVVTPSFQQAPFLGATLASVLGAGVPLDYVVQDGGSTDGSVDVIRCHADRLATWESAPDRGQADAIARGFAKTTGAPDDVMAWINSDDFYLPGALGYVADYFARHPAVDVVYGHRILVDEHAQEIGRWFLPPHDDAILRLNDFVPQETMFWRRRLWDKVGGINPSFKFAMDWDLLLRFQAAGAKIVRVPYFLACFRIHSAQKTSAQMESVGQSEIDALRRRTFGRDFTPAEIEDHPALQRYLRRSAWIELLWRRLRLRSR